MLFYTILEASHTNALLVLDDNGVLYYASLGKDVRRLIMSMKSDFAMYSKKTKLGPVRFEATPHSKQVKLTIDTYRSIIDYPDTLDRARKIIKYRLFGGTRLQNEVWDYLMCNTNPLQTTTYGEIANALGLNASLSRAVGNACGANKLAILIPCHRVISSAGKITGYKWGTDIKKELLMREKMVHTAIRTTSPPM